MTRNVQRTLICLMLFTFFWTGPAFCQTDVQAKAARKIHRKQRIDPATLTTTARNLGLRSRAPKSAVGSPTPVADWIPDPHGASVDWVALRSNHPPGWKIDRDQQTGTPYFIRNNSSAPTAKTVQQPIESAAPTTLDFVQTNRKLFRLDEPNTELVVTKVNRDEWGRDHVKFQQQYRGLPVWGQEMVVHLGPGGSMYSFNGRYVPTPVDLIDTTPTVTASAAIQTAEDHLSRRVPIQEMTGRVAELFNYDGPTAELQIWTNGTTPHLTWHVEVRPNWRQRWLYFIDAQAGTILQSSNATPTEGPTTAQGVDLNGREQTLRIYDFDDEFVLLDASRPVFGASQPNLYWNPQGALWTLTQGFADFGEAELNQVSSLDNGWEDPAAVSAHDNMARVFDYFLNVHGRAGIDGEGGTLISVVHATDGGADMENAFWNNPFMVYGDGGPDFAPLAGALDVAAHEFTHGVIENTINLDYVMESGALNESFADIFGAMVDREDWLMGEDIAITSMALRDLETPENGDQPSHMDDFLDLASLNDLYGFPADTPADFEANDWSGVHINSGIPNRACFLIAEAIGREKTEQIYYHIIDANLLISRARFIDMRLAAQQSAIDLFSEDSAEEAAVLAAFDAVGILDDEATAAPEDLQPVEGDEWIVVVNAEPDDASLLMTRPVVESDDDFRWLTFTQVSIESGSPVSALDDGSSLLFIDAENFIRGISTDGSGEELLSETGEWGSLAVSPDGGLLAATTVYEDTTIFVFDLVDPDNFKAIHLYNLTTQEGLTADVTRFADALAWDHSGQYIVYDAFNSVPLADDNAVGFWNISVLNVETESISPLISGLPVNVHLANPTVARTNDDFVVFDFFDVETELNEIWVFDLFTGDAGFIAETGPNFAFPTFSSDDRFLAFEFTEDEVLNVHKIPLDESRLQSTGPSEEVLFEVQLPTWITIGERVTAVEEEADEVPLSYELGQNYPNPFNAETIIRYSLPVGADTRLAVFDVLSRRVTLLEDGPKPAGNYTVRWNGEDDRGRTVANGVYIYRLETAGRHRPGTRLTKKMVLLQ